MNADASFRSQPPEFWALVKLVSQLIGYSTKGAHGDSGGIRRYTADEIRRALRQRGLGDAADDARIRLVASYSAVRASLLEDVAHPNLMTREQAAAVFDELRKAIEPPPALLPMNKQSGEKRHFAYLTGIVNMLTYRELCLRFGEAHFDANPRGPLTFAREGMPLRTLFRWMDGAYPGVNHPHAAWEIKEYYGTKTFGSRVADGVYETALDGYELNDLREVGVEVKHYLFVDDHFTWWTKGKSYLCRIVDLVHLGLVDSAFFGKEVLEEWPKVIATWPASSPG